MAKSPALMLLLASLAGFALAGRRLEVINNCAHPVEIGVTGGNTEVKCESGKCAEGLTCNPDTETCYFDMPEFSLGGGRQLSAFHSVVMTTPNAPIKQGNGVTADWSGKLDFVADRSAEGITVPSAFCNNMDHCPTYRGLNGVATAVEFTFVPEGTDFYDLSMINGISVSAEMGPDGLEEYVTDEEAGNTQGYSCGVAGAHKQKGERLSSCAWRFADKDFGLPGHGTLVSLVTQVDGGHGACASNKDCAAKGLVCGQVAKVALHPDTGLLQPTHGLSMECGHKIGMWSAYQLCVWSGNTYVSPAPFEGVLDCPKMHSMFACADKEPWTTTCYKQGVVGPCCGCVDWQEVLGQKCPASHGCVSNSTEWAEKALPFYKPLKAACPTAYTYAFDDETSTFTCRTKKNFLREKNNSVGYTIKLCAENRTADIPVVPVGPVDPADPAPFVDPDDPDVDGKKIEKGNVMSVVIVACMVLAGLTIGFFHYYGSGDAAMAGTLSGGAGPQDLLGMEAELSVTNTQSGA